MKAISLWQPWASAMALGLKHNETRSWPTSYRGDLVICAAKKKLNDIDASSLSPAAYEIWRSGFPLGVAVCVVEVYDCWQTERITNLRHPVSKFEIELGDYTPGRFAWLTRNCRRLATPVPITGRQGMWNLTPEMVQLVKAQMIPEVKA